MLQHLPNRFLGRITNCTGRPSTTWGTSISTTQNAYGSYTEIISDTAYETFFMVIGVFDVASSGANKNCLVTIGIDHSGGTTYTDVEINHLMCASAAPWTVGGRWYSFPLYVPAGSAIAGKASVDNATPGTCRVAMYLYGRPSRPELVSCCKYVDTFGATTGSSSGTSITSGTASEGSWTEMTSSTTTKPYWWFQMGMGSSDISLTQLVYGMDLSVGDATNKEIVFEDHLWVNNGTAEQVHTFGGGVLDQYICPVPDGQRIYARLQCSGTADSSLSMIAYAAGG